VAKILDNGGATARAVADQLGHAKVSMTQDNYLERGLSNAGNARILESAVQI
jgi:integrase